MANGLYAEVTKKHFHRINMLTDMLLERSELGVLNPVFLNEDKKWYFYDETWSYPYGPFESRLDAELGLLNYCEGLCRPNEPNYS